MWFRRVSKAQSADMKEVGSVTVEVTKSAGAEEVETKEAVKSTPPPQTQTTPKKEWLPTIARATATTSSTSLSTSDDAISAVSKPIEATEPDRATPKSTKEDDKSHLNEPPKDKDIKQRQSWSLFPARQSSSASITSNTKSPSPATHAAASALHSLSAHAVLPSFDDIFHAGPRRLPPQTFLSRAWSFFSYPFSSSATPSSPSTTSANTTYSSSPPTTTQLPVRVPTPDLTAISSIAVIGVHGWFPAPWTRPLFGEPKGTSQRFANEMDKAIRAYFAAHNVALTNEHITQMPLEGQGKIHDRVDMLYAELHKRPHWIETLRKANVVFLASHSQGAIVSTILLDRLITEKIVKPSKIVLLCMASISHGPFTTHWSYQPYLYLESDAAKELFHLQQANSLVSTAYEKSLANICQHGAKVVFVASLNDQVVPLYSGLANSYSHPAILRSTFIDRAVLSQTDFAVRLVVFLTSLLNAGLSDHGLLNLISTPLAGSVEGMGHSQLYNDPNVYRIGVQYFFQSSPLPTSNIMSPSLKSDSPLNPSDKNNTYLIPWALRGILEDPKIRYHFDKELGHLRESFDSWNPTLKPLQNLRAALSPLQTIPRWDAAHPSRL